MSQEIQIETIKGYLIPLLEEDIFLVGIKVKPINNIKIYLDADQGLPIEKCVKINRALYKTIEEAGLYPDGDFSLEVSSPGIDEPLKLLRQYKKNQGREVEVLSHADEKIMGKLMQITDEGIILETRMGKGKKTVVEQKEISFSAIKQTKVQIKI